MAEFNEENKVDGVYGGAEINTNENQETNINFTKINSDSLPTKPTLWSKIRSLLFQEIDWNAPIKVELTPYQQKIEDEINEFLHQEISFKGFWNIVTK